jgi:hypothetical protein
MSEVHVASDMRVSEDLYFEVAVNECIGLP